MRSVELENRGVFGYRRQIEKMPPIDRPYTAISAIKAPVIRIRITLVAKNAASSDPWIADAMRPSIVRVDSDATRDATLDGKDEAVIAGRTAGIGFNDVAIVLSGLRILEAQAPALVRVSGRRARWVIRAIERTRAQSKKDGRIEILRGPQMGSTVSKVSRRYQPICPDLLLEAQIPLGNLHCR